LRVLNKIYLTALFVIPQVYTEDEHAMIDLTGMC
jgi:hypothetical protein